jgi:hypothetical protein
MCGILGGWEVKLHVTTKTITFRFNIGRGVLRMNHLGFAVIWSL